MTYKKIIFLILLLTAFLIGLFVGPFHKFKHPTRQTAQHPIKILVSIKPLYSLVLGLTKNVPGVETKLLLSPPNSPHTFHLKPSDVTKIVHADLVIWVGPELENFLINPLANLKSKSQQLPLMQAAPLALLQVRNDKQWEPHSHSHEGEHDHDHHHDHNHDHDHSDHAHSHSVDPHIWLNTENAKQMVLTLSSTLQKIDPHHQAIYQNNTERLLKKLDALHGEIQNNLQATEPKPFLVFHDAYQYFEKEFDLKAAGSITLNPQVPLSAKRLNQIQRTIKDRHIQCVFSEPEFNKGLVQKLLVNTHTQQFELDPLGARFRMKPHQEEEFYFDLMRGLGKTFKGCFVG